MMFSSGSRLRFGRLDDDDAPARQSLADIVVGVAGELERNAARQEGAEALPGGAAEAHGDRVLGQPGMAVAPRHLARQHGADGAMDVAQLALDAHRFAALQRRAGARDQLVIDRLFEMVVLRLAIVDRDALLGRHLIENLRQIDALGFPVIDRLAHVEPVDAPDHLARSVRKPSLAMSSRTSSATKKK